MIINYITNLPKNMVSGGWSGMNFAIYSRLIQYFELNYVGPINPLQDWTGKILSKCVRLFGMRGSFHFFSNNRLNKISQALEASCNSIADLDFYLGATPWVRFRPRRPYFAYVDASFSAYVRFYQSFNEFSRRDLNRIKLLEKSWMNNATAVFFSSEWALQDAKSEYGLHGDNLAVAGVGGNIEIPEADTWAGEMNFLAVVTDFERKGGRISFEAFKMVQQFIPKARLVFVGVKPPGEILAHHAVEYKGFLRKDVPEQNAALVKLFAEAFVLLLPSSADTTPIIIAELGYFGCPTIAPRQFGIPEMVRNGQTGILIDSPPTADTLAGAMLQLYNIDNYREMRSEVRRFTMDKMNWDKVVERMALRIKL